jgi:hypothetical protein
VHGHAACISYTDLHYSSDIHTADKSIHITSHGELVMALSKVRLKEPVKNKLPPTYVGYVEANLSQNG